MTIGGSKAYTTPDFLEKNIIVASDAIWYFAPNGEATVSFWVASHERRTVNLRIETEKKNVLLKNVKVNEVPMPFEVGNRNRHELVSNLRITEEPVKVTFLLNFDPQKIGLSEKFDIIVSDHLDNELVRLDPFISGYTERYPINIQTYSEIVDNNITLSKSNVNTASWGCLDLNSFAIGLQNGADVTSIDLNISGACHSDINFSWKSRFAIPASTSFVSTDSNGYYMYVTSNVVSNPKRNLDNVFLFFDSWEDSDYTSNPVWTQSGDPVTTISSQKVDGLFSTYYDYQTQPPKLTIDRNVTGGTTFFEWWIRPVNVNLGTSEGPNNVILYNRTAQVIILIKIVSDNFYSTPSGNIGTSVPVVDNWYKIRVKYIDNNNLFDVNVYGVNGNLLENIQNMGTFGGNSGSIGRIELSSDLADTYFDGIKVWSEPNVTPNITIGAKETASGAITYTINVPSSGVKIRSLTLDVNYSVASNDCNLMTTTVKDLFEANEKTLGIYSDTNNLNRGLTATILPNEGTHILSISGICDANTAIVGDANSIYYLNYGSITGSIYDENTMTKIPYKTYTFNGTSGTANENGDINISLYGLETNRYLLSVDSNNIYSQRLFYFDLNNFSYLDVNLLALKNYQGQSIEFNHYKPDATTVIPSGSLTEFKRQFPINGLAARYFVPVGLAQSVFVQKDANYNRRIISNDTNVQYDYNNTTINISKPLDLSTITSVSSYRVRTTGVSEDDTGYITDAISIPFFSDTTSYYLVQIDENVAHYSVTLITSTKGGADATIQPYLVPTEAASGIETTVYTLDEQNNRTALGNILLESYVDINGASALVESDYSDYAGTATMHFDLLRNYTIKVYQSGVLKATLSLTPSSTSLFVFIETGTYSGLTQIGGVQIEWYHSPSNFLQSIDGNLEMWQILRPFGGVILGIANISFIQDGIVKYSVDKNINSANDYNLVTDINVSEKGLSEFKPFMMNLRIYDVHNNLLTDSNAMYSFVQTAGAVYQQAIGYIRDGFGSLATTIIAVLLTLIAVWKLTVLRLGEDNNSLVIISILITGIFAFFGFIPLIAWSLGTLGGASVLIWRMRD